MSMLIYGVIHTPIYEHALVSMLDTAPAMLPAGAEPGAFVSPLKIMPDFEHSRTM